MNTVDVPEIVRLTSRDFHTTEDESAGVLQYLIEGNDLILYGLPNVVTRHSQSVESYDRAMTLENIGYKVLTMPPRQQNKINQMAAQMSGLTRGGKQYV